MVPSTIVGHAPTIAGTTTPKNPTRVTAVRLIGNEGKIRSLAAQQESVHHTQRSTRLYGSYLHIDA